jgi:O-antigen/teichoic acid export membrane protein
MNGLPPQPDSPAAVDSAPAFSPWMARGRHVAGWAGKIAEFAAVQGIVQVFLAGAGILIVRTLSKEQYAAFAIANSIQVMFNALADLGIGIGVRSIGGRVYRDPRKFGALLKTALHLRYRFALASFALCIPLGAWMLLRNGASPALTVSLCLLLVVSAVPLLSYAIWNTSLQLHGEYRRIQRVDLGNAAVRLGIIGALCSWLNSVWALLAGAITNWIQLFFTRRWGEQHVDMSAPPDARYRKELLRLSAKSLPNTLFFCFQGQVTLLILSLFGTSTGVANITALGRIAAIFAVFASLLSNLLGPGFARCQDAKRLPRLYAMVLGGTILGLAVLLTAAALWPGPFLWLLGSKYSGLEHEYVWVIAAACVAHLGNTMWNLNSSKAWITLQVKFHIPLMIAAQALAIVFLDMRSFHDVLVFNLVVSATPLIAYSADAFLAMSRLRSAEQTHNNKGNRD